VKWAVELTATLMATAAGGAYAVVRGAYANFYDRFAATPESIGLSEFDLLSASSSALLTVGVSALLGAAFLLPLRSVESWATVFACILGLAASIGAVVGLMAFFYPNSGWLVLVFVLTQLCVLLIAQPLMPVGTSKLGAACLTGVLFAVVWVSWTLASVWALDEPGPYHATVSVIGINTSVKAVDVSLSSSEVPLPGGPSALFLGSDEGFHYFASGLVRADEIGSLVFEPPAGREPRWWALLGALGAVPVTLALLLIEDVVSYVHRKTGHAAHILTDAELDLARQRFPDGNVGQFGVLLAFGVSTRQTSRGNRPPNLHLWDAALDWLKDDTSQSKILIAQPIYRTMMDEYYDSTRVAPGDSVNSATKMIHFLEYNPGRYLSTTDATSQALTAFDEIAPRYTKGEKEEDWRKVFVFRAQVQDRRIKRLLKRTKHTLVTRDGAEMKTKSVLTSCQQWWADDSQFQVRSKSRYAVATALGWLVKRTRLGDLFNAPPPRNVSVAPSNDQVELILGGDGPIIIDLREQRQPANPPAPQTSSGA